MNFVISPIVSGMLILIHYLGLKVTYDYYYKGQGTDPHLPNLRDELPSNLGMYMEIER